MNDSVRTACITLLTGSLGPQEHMTLTIPIPDGAALPPLLIEDPSPDYPGAWRRVSEHTDHHEYVRVARIAAP